MATTAQPADVPREDPFERVWQSPRGLWGFLTTVQNTPIGMRIVGTAFLFFLLGGINALLMRTQLARAENTLTNPDLYNQLFTMHGTTMMFLFAVPFLEGLATLALPQLLGARDLPFPRLTSFAFWSFLFGGLLFYSSWFFGAVPDGGWFAYPPLTGPVYSPGLGIDFWLLGLSVAEIGAIAGAIELIVSIFKMRTPGMSINRMPIFAWSILVMAFSMIFAFTPLIVGSLFLETDRKFGTHFFNPDAGGDPLLWQHIFWIFGHPEVYIQFIPATGIVSMVLPVFVRHRLVGYPFIVFALVATGFVSFGLWVHHMFTVGLPQLGLFFFSVASMLIAIPTGIQIFAWLATIWNGRPVWKTAFLFVVGFLVIFVLGGITGVMVGSVPFDWQVHDSYFVVAHFHYVLIGGVVFPVFAGIYYWFPKYTGRMLDERLGKWNFWLMFIGFNVAFFPMHIVGLLGMPRRVYTYQVDTAWEPYNLVSTVGAFLLALGILVFVWNAIQSLLRGEEAGNNPWDADSLEWAMSSPVPPVGFRVFPIVHSRHPLWDQEGLHEGDEKTERLVQALGKWPDRWRAQIVTSTLDARPEEVFRVAGPSIWPVAAAIGLTAVFGGLLFDRYVVVAVGALVVVVASVAWNWPAEVPDAEKEEAFEAEHGIPVHTAGSPAVARWGVLLSTTVAAIILATCLFTYFYLRLSAPVWPPMGISAPALTLPAVRTGVILLAALATYWAVRSIRDGRQDRLKIGLAVAFVLGAVFLGIQAYELSRLNFSWDTNAYGSIFWVTAVVQALITIAALGMSAVTQYWAWQGHYSARRHNAVQNLALYWYFLAAAWVAVFATLYVSPYLI